MNTYKMRRRNERGRRGAAMIVVLFLIMVTSMLLIGVATSSISHQKLAYVDSTWAGAIDLAEAGLNYEMRKISQNTANADQSPGSTYSLGTGTFRVYCKNANGTTPWTPPGDLYIVSTGTVAGVSRTVTTMAHRAEGGGTYACYAMNQGIVNGGATINGSLGTNHSFIINGTPITITGEVDLNGSGTSATVNPVGICTPVHNASPINWPTVVTAANTAFPASIYPPGGLAYLATHNDNTLATGSGISGILNGSIYSNGSAAHAIASNAISLTGSGTITLYGKAGGANYYLTNLLFNGSGANLALNNSAGSITLWMGPSGGGGSCTFNGGTATIKMSQNPAYACILYSALSSGVVLNGSVETDLGIYNYNGSTGGQVTFNGTGHLSGAVISNNFTFNGSWSDTYTSGYFQPPGVDFTFDGSWAELTAR